MAARPDTASPASTTSTASDTGITLPEGGKPLRRHIARLAAPIVGENVLETSLDMVNIAMVAGLGAAAVAGVGAATQVMFVVLSALTAMSVGTSVLVAQAVGAGNPRRASRLARQSLLWSVAIAAPVAVIGQVAARPVVALFGVAQDVSDIATAYLRISLGTIVILMALLISSAVLRGTGNTKTPMRATLFANVLNAALAGALIYGWGPFPAIGVLGAAWATLASRGVALTIVLRALWQGHGGVRLSLPTGRRPDVRVLRNILRLGLPSAGEQLVISTAWFMFTVLVAGLGTSALAGQRVAMTLLSLCFLPGFALGMATTVLVGHGVGARRFDIALRVGRTTTVWAVLWTLFAGGAVFAFAPQLMGIFTDSPDVVRLGSAALRVMVFTQPFWGIAMTSSGALRGMSDTRTPLLIEAVGNWTAIGLIWLMVSSGHGSLPLAWGAYVLVGPCIGGSMFFAMHRRARRLAARQLPVRPAADTVSTAGASPAVVTELPASAVDEVAAAAIPAQTPRMRQSETSSA